VTALAVFVGSIPSPPWNQISIGPLNLRFYGLMIALGVIAGVWLLGKQLEQHRLGTTDDAGSIAVWGVIAGLIGARLYHVITDWSRFSDDLGAIPKVWEGGLGIPGGLIAGILVGAWQARRRGFRPGVILTFGAPAIALAQSIARWGNWFNQELFGKPTDLPWALEIDDEHLPNGFTSGTTFHPAFLYESLWNLALCVVLLRVQRQFRLAPGRLLAVYAIGYGAGRYWIEGLRIDPASEVGGLRWNQWMALAAIAVGIVYLVATRGKKWDVAPGDGAATLVPVDTGADDVAADADDDDDVVDVDVGGAGGVDGAGDGGGGD
jgi:prolipoprotein diacylglyceryl transferase